MTENPQQINDILDFVFAWGPVWVYAVLFLACFIENIFPPFPGDSFIVAAGALVGLQRLDFVPAFLVVIVGGVTSVMVLFLFGKKVGRGFFVRRNYKYFSADDIYEMERKFRTWGILILAFSRFIVGMRSVLAVAAGISRYPSVPMLVLSTFSYILFVGIVMYLSIKLVENFDTISYYFRTYNTVAWVIVITVVAFFVVRKVMAIRKQGRKK